MKKKLMVGLFALCMCLTMISANGFAAEKDKDETASEATEVVSNLVDLKDDSIYFKQSRRGICTLAANVMMIRRAKILMNDENWADATESSVGAVGWRNGMLWNFTYDDVTIAYQAGHLSAEDMKSLLEEHPEGIVVYDTSIPHAICLTDYDEEEDVFYCADSATGFPEGRITTDDALIHMNNISAMWYVASTKVPINKKPVRVPVAEE